MPPFVPKPRAVRDIDRRLRDTRRAKQDAQSTLVALLDAIDDLDEQVDGLLALRSAEAARHSW